MSYPPQQIVSCTRRKQTNLQRNAWISGHWWRVHALSLICSFLQQIRKTRTARILIGPTASWQKSWLAKILSKGAKKEVTRPNHKKLTQLLYFAFRFCLQLFILSESGMILRLRHKNRFSVHLNSQSDKTKRNTQNSDFPPRPSLWCLEHQLPAIKKRKEMQLKKKHEQSEDKCKKCPVKMQHRKKERKTVEACICPVLCQVTGPEPLTQRISFENHRKFSAQMCLTRGFEEVFPGTWNVQTPDYFTTFEKCAK